MKIKSAIILAGGKGERLRPLTDNIPKPMIDILGRPLVEYQVLWLKDQGVEHIVFACGYKHQVLQDYFQDGDKWDLKINYSIEEEPLGRGGAFKKALQLVPVEENIIYGANGDEIILEQLQQMVDFHLKNQSLATLLLSPLISPFGIVEINQQGKVTGFREKPQLPHLINAGAYIFSRDCIEMFPDIGDHEDTVFPELVEKGKIFGFKAVNFKGTVNTIKELNDLTEKLPLHFPKKLLLS